MVLEAERQGSARRALADFVEANFRLPARVAPLEPGVPILELPIDCRARAMSDAIEPRWPLTPTALRSSASWKRPI